MCVTCKPIRDYQIIADAQTMTHVKDHAYHLVDEGLFTLNYEIDDPTTHYQEIQFHCEDCGKTHVLWLHTYLCRVGGEWRSI